MKIVDLFEKTPEEKDYAKSQEFRKAVADRDVRNVGRLLHRRVFRASRANRNRKRTRDQ